MLSVVLPTTECPAKSVWWWQDSFCPFQPFVGISFHVENIWSSQTDCFDDWLASLSASTCISIQPSCNFAPSLAFERTPQITSAFISSVLIAAT